MRTIAVLLAALALLLAGCGGGSSDEKTESSDSSEADKPEYHEKVSDVLLDGEPLTGDDLEMAKQLVHKTDLLTELASGATTSTDPTVKEFSGEYRTGLFEPTENRLEAVLIGPPSTADEWDAARNIEDEDSKRVEDVVGRLPGVVGGQQDAVNDFNALVPELIESARSYAVEVSDKAENPDLAQAGVENAERLEQMTSDVKAMGIG